MEFVEIFMKRSKDVKLYLNRSNNYSDETDYILVSGSYKHYFRFLYLCAHTNLGSGAMYIHFQYMAKRNSIPSYSYNTSYSARRPECPLRPGMLASVLNGQLDINNFLGTRASKIAMFGNK